MMPARIRFAFADLTDQALRVRNGSSDSVIPQCRLNVWITPESGRIADIGGRLKVPLAANAMPKNMCALARSFLFLVAMSAFSQQLAYKFNLGARSVWHSAIGRRGEG
jgi:hypothetical protein